MQPEFQKTNKGAPDFPTATVIRRIVVELFSVLLALCAFGVTNAYLAPLYVDDSLLPISYTTDTSPTTNYKQSGWPLPCCATYWVDYHKGTENSGYNSGSFNFVSLAIDLLFFYTLIRLVAFILRLASHLIDHRKMHHDD